MHFPFFLDSSDGRVVGRTGNKARGGNTCQLDSRVSSSCTFPFTFVVAQKGLDASFFSVFVMSGQQIFVVLYLRIFSKIFVSCQQMVMIFINISLTFIFNFLLTFTCYTINLLLLSIISTFYLFHIYISLSSLDCVI